MAAVDRRTFLRVSGAATTVAITGCSTNDVGPDSSSNAAATTTVQAATTETTRPERTTVASTADASTTSSGTTSPTEISSTTIEASTSTAAATTTSAPALADLDALANALQGQLVRPNDDAYDMVRLLQCSSFDGSHPIAIAVVRSDADVATAVSYAHQHALPLAVRSGGHSYGGWSSCKGIVIDLRGLAAITVDVTRATAQIGPGAALIDIYSTLAASGVVIPGGSCPTVASPASRWAAGTD